MSKSQSDMLVESNNVDLNNGFLSRLGEVSQAQRLSLGLTHAQLSDRSGLSESQIDQLEAGNWDIDVLSFWTLSSSLNTTASRLLKGTESNVIHLKV